jgi:hypothetical protein
VKTYKHEVVGTAEATRVATALIIASQWFAFEPLPDDVYEFTVKIENTARLVSIIVPRKVAGAREGAGF